MFTLNMKAVFPASIYEMMMVLKW